MDTTRIHPLLSFTNIILTRKICAHVFRHRRRQYESIFSHNQCLKKIFHDAYFVLQQMTVESPLQIAVTALLDPPGSISYEAV